MKHNVTLTISSLLSILLATLHLSDDIARGLEGGGIANLIAVPVLVAWLYGTLVLAERRSGYVIILLGSLLGMLMAWVHFNGSAGVLGGDVAKSGGVLFFVWTLIALAVSSLFSLVLAVRGLLRREPRAPR